MFLGQVGDVVLVPDEGVIDNGYTMVGLETLVCFTVSCGLNLCIIIFYMIYERISYSW